jgi:hypothetical protein
MLVPLSLLNRNWWVLHDYVNHFIHLANHQTKKQTNYTEQNPSKEKLLSSSDNLILVTAGGKEASCPGGGKQRMQLQHFSLCFKSIV